MRLLLINPRCAESFWSFRFALAEIVPGKRALNPPLGLATLAALTPPHWQVEIVGFDADTLETFERQRRFVMASSIPAAMIGLLTALPRTPLYERLRREGRLLDGADDADNTRLGTNLLPRLMSPSALVAGYRELYRELPTDRGNDELDGRFFRRIAPRLERLLRRTPATLTLRIEQLQARHVAALERLLARIARHGDRVSVVIHETLRKLVRVDSSVIDLVLGERGARSGA